MPELNDEQSWQEKIREIDRRLKALETGGEKKVCPTCYGREEIIRHYAGFSHGWVPCPTCKVAAPAPTVEDGGEAENPIARCWFDLSKEYDALKTNYSALQERVRELEEIGREVCSAYDRYRARGSIGAPVESNRLSIAINSALRAALNKEPGDD